uniref:Beta-mannosidase n=1 Tax=Meloidogyne javanica TaxID=6303 RepID=A0A915M8Q4_MELJA
MNYPKSELTPKLGIVYIQKPTFTVQIDLNVSSDPILIWMQAHSFLLTDENSQIYSQRLRVGNFDNKLNGKSLPCIQMKLIK